MGIGMKRRLVAGFYVAGLMGCLLSFASSAAAESAWVRGAPLNMRSGPGNEFRILGTTQPGDRMNVLKRGEGWTRIETGEGKKGWIAAGYLDPQAPPAIRLAEVEAEVAQLRESLSSTTADSERLRSSNDTLSSNDTGQKQEIERLTKDNYKLRAGTRSAEWLTGALILSMGMVLGAILHSITGRRRSQRLRL